MHRRTIFLTLAVLAIGVLPVFGSGAEARTKDAREFPSPDGHFAFRYSAGTEEEAKTYDLIATDSGKVLTHVAESNDELGPSARFSMKVLWRPDSKAFALTATLWKRGSSVSVFRRDGATFREVKLPELLAEISEKAMRGKEFPHVVEVSSQSAKQWHEDGSLLVEIESIQDGNGATITAKRTVILGFRSAGKATILSSELKYKTEVP